ncbi:hypothetical protein [Mucilaginibacter puniceus]
MKRTKMLFVITNLVLSLLGVFILFFTSVFWLGSDEQFQQVYKNSYWIFLAYRLLFDVIVSLLMVAIIGIVNWLLKKITVHIQTPIWKVLAINFLIFFVASIVFISVIWGNISK